MNHGTWDGYWTKLGESAAYGTFPGGLALTTYDGNWSSAGVVDVFALSNYYGTDTRIFHIRCGYFRGSCAPSWDMPPGQGNFPSGAHATADLTVTAFSPLRDDLFIRDTGGNLEHTYWDPHFNPSNNPPGWPAQWENLDSPPIGLAGELSAFSWGSPDQEVTVVGLDDHRYQMRYGNPGSQQCRLGSGNPCWNGWYSITGT